MCDNFKEKEIHKFKCIDSDSDIEIIDKQLEFNIEDNMQSSNNQVPPIPSDGYIRLPSKLSFNLFIGWMAHLIVLTAGGVGMYMSIQSEQIRLADKIERIEKSMYTKEEANLRREMFEREVALLKDELRESKKK